MKLSKPQHGLKSHKPHYYKQRGQHPSLSFGQFFKFQDTNTLCEYNGKRYSSHQKLYHVVNLPSSSDGFTGPVSFSHIETKAKYMKEQFQTQDNKKQDSTTREKGNKKMNLLLSQLTS